MSDEFNIEIPLHPAQRVFITDPHKYLVMDAGRQMGKSHGCAAFCSVQALSKPGSVGWVISPTYKQSAVLLKKIEKLLKDNRVPIKMKNTPQDMSITVLWNGSVISAVSADNPNNLRGATLDFLVFDEAAMIPDDTIWYEILMPMCWKEDCKVRFISTPKGKNWFYDLYKMAEDNEDWVSYHYTSDDNPFMPKSFIKSMEKRLDRDTFRQEILAEFIEGGGLVFYDYDLAPVNGHIPQPTDMFIAGVDLAKTVDFTVITVINIMTAEVCYVDRWQKCSWEETIERIYDVYNQYNQCPMIVDSTGVGDPIVERLLDKGINAYSFVFSAKTKPQVVRNLVAMLQSRELRLPDVKYYKDEFERFSYNVTPMGNVQYSAPRGYHDDCVMSMCLAAWGLVTTPTDVGYIYENTIGDDHEYDEFAFNIDKRDLDLFKESYQDSVDYFTKVR